MYTRAYTPRLVYTLLCGVVSVYPYEHHNCIKCRLLRCSDPLNIFTLLPVTCSETGGRVHRLHLRDVITQLQLNIDDVEFSKLWDRCVSAVGQVRVFCIFCGTGACTHTNFVTHDTCACVYMHDTYVSVLCCDVRFDAQGAGAVRTSHFLKLLGLDDAGCPRPYTTPRHVLMNRDDQPIRKVVGPSPVVNSSKDTTTTAADKVSASR